MGQDTAGAADRDRAIAPDGTPADEAHPAEGRTAAFFDLDKTIIATSSATAFSRGFLAEGLLTRRNVLRTAVAQFLYLVGGADEVQTERLRANLSRTVAGWPVSQVSQVVAETLHEAIDPTVYAEAVALIEEHHAAGHDVVIVSASGSEIVEPIAAVLGADHVVATRMQVLDGRYTGDIDFYAYGENKAVAVRELAEHHGYDLEASFAYSDSITDAPMLAAVGHGFAVNPDRTLRRAALENGWGTLTFRRPVPLLGFDREARVTTGVVVGLVVAAGVAWWTVRRVRRARAA